MYLFTEYVFRESVDSADNSQISSTFQEADCLLKLVKINKQVFAITLLSRNLNHTAQLSISARGDNNFVSKAGGKKVYIYIIIKFQNYFFEVTKFWKEWKIWPKTHFIVFALFVGNFSNKHHYFLLKILRIFCLWYFCPKWLFPKLFVLKVDLCIEVVALIKITTVRSVPLLIHK